MLDDEMPVSLSNIPQNIHPINLIHPVKIHSWRSPESSMYRRRLEEALLKSREMNNSDKNIEDESDEDATGRHSLFAVRNHFPSYKDKYGIYSLRFSPSGKQLAIGFGNGAIQIINVESGKVDATLFPGHPNKPAVTGLNYHPKSEDLLVAAAVDGTINIYDIVSGLNIFSLIEQGNEINALDFCMDGSVYATAGKDRNIRLYDSHKNEVLNTFEAPNPLTQSELSPLSGHSRRIFALKFHPSEYHIFLTGGWDDSIKVWDKRMAKEARNSLSGPHICGPGIDIKNNMVLTASWVAQNALQLWDLRSTRPLQDIHFPASSLKGEFLYTGQFYSDTVVIAGGSGTCSACAIDYKTQNVVGEISLNNNAVQTVDVSPSGCLSSVAGIEGNLHIAELY